MTNTQQEQRHEMMIKTPVDKLIMKMAIPTVVAMMISSIYNMADTYFVSQLSTAASGAVGIIFPLMSMIQAIGFLFGAGGGSTVSRYLGAKKNIEAQQVASTAFYFSLLAGSLLTFFGLFFLNDLIMLLGATPTIFPYAHSYGLFILIGAPYMAAAFTLNNLLRSQGNAFKSMIGITVGAVLNIVLDPIFIFAFNMETSGAALATIISQLVSFIILFNMINDKDSLIRIRFKDIRLSANILGEIIRVGMPSFFRQGLASLSAVLLNTQARVYGDSLIASMSIVSRIYMFIFSTSLGLGQGYQPVCGYNYGAKEYQRVKDGFWFFVKTVTLIFIIVSSIAYIFAPSIIAIFRRNDPEVILIGSQALRYYALSIPFLSWTIACNMTSQATGKSLYASIISIAQQGLFFIPIVLILPQYIGMQAIQMTIPLANTLTFLITIPIGAVLLKEFRHKK
ncbi:MAG: MATE family efflux transporter [Erysipelotrichaceae bacterium]|nr:MATE family efflux transporter [Erysipelotrichaceae bacterium]